MAAALLHDTVADTDASLEEIEARFGARVASIVAEVSDHKDLTPSERKHRQITSAKGKSFGAKLVKLAEKTADLRDILTAPPADWNFQRKADYFDWSKQVVDELRGTNSRLEAAFDHANARRALITA